MTSTTLPVDLLAWSPVPTLVLDADGRARSVNAAAGALLGGGDLLDRAAFTAPGAGAPGLAELPEREVGTALRTELVWAHPDGYRLHLDVRAVVVPAPWDATTTALLLHLEDLTPLRDASAALASAEAQLRAAFAAAPIGMALVSADGWLLEVNPALAALVGTTPAQLLATPLVDLLADDPDPELVDSLLSGAGADEVALRLRRPGGVARARCSAREVRDQDGAVRHVVLQLTDVTAQLEAEEDLQRTVRELERVNEDLEAFAHVAAHDLRSPLASLRGLVEAVRMLAADELSERADGYLVRAIASADRMDGLVTDLLAFARLGHEGGRPEVVDLAALVADVLAGLEQVLVSNGAEVVVGELPAELLGDGLQLRQLVQNLVANALKFHAPGDAPRVEVRCVPTRDVWELRVVDHGIGIPEEKRADVFAPFVRLHGRTRYEGTGVGLAICQRVAEVHGGTIHVEATPGGGATFVVRLPRAAAQGRAPLR